MSNQLLNLKQQEEKIYRALFIDYESCCLVSALKANLFNIVKNSDQSTITLNDLIEKCHFGKRNGSAIIHVLTACGYLEVVDKKYRLTDISKAYFASEEKKNWSPLFDIFVHCSPRLLKAVENNSPEREHNWKTSIIDSWQENNLNEEEASKFSKVMDIMHAESSERLSKAVDFKSQFHVDSILDVGGGSGCYSIAIAKNQPGMKTIVCDLENVCKATQTYIDSSIDSIPSESRVLTFAGDMFKGVFPKYDDELFGYQSVFLSDILHDWSEESCELICKNVYDSLPANGYIFLHEMLFNDDFSGPLTTALMSFNMFMMTNGRQFSFGELKTILKGCGFGEICEVRYGSHHSLIVAKKIVAS